ncbi:ATPase [Leptospira perolatii]|uniref:ATPase n=1 Tax=Leptospira perolatii TaxID=2023191 RepID=A0A2M9ZKG7_9LEPT|nr:ATP cone domain-containing protein [Leptospira perolatii]PJZ68144.1 ATPase [Leptospira perolatii]PJZ72562.1 ATPase [Leptospira perolatii]
MSRKKKRYSVVKSSGEVSEFSEEKIRNSLKKTGADQQTIEKIVNKIKEKKLDEFPTKNIYKIAYQTLKESSRTSASKYHLKNGIMELGPSGYPFEEFISEILSHQGYITEVGIIVEGFCVSHEIDVIAQKENKHFMIECKYHNLPGIVSDVKIPLYIFARFLDVEKQWKKLSGHQKKFHQGWIVTNTRFTSDAIKYGACSGLHLVSWDYPKGDSLREQIDRLGLYPITCLTTLSKHEKEILLGMRVVLCKTLCDKPELLVEAGIPKERRILIESEARALCEKLGT